MKKTPILTEEHVQTLRNVLSGHPLESIITLALATGLRRDELLNLKWQDVDLNTSQLSIRNAKTKEIETVHISEDEALMLEQHRKLQMETQADQVSSNPDLVFPGPLGGPLSPHHLVKGLREVVEQAGLPHISFHDLRRHAKQKELAKLQEMKG